MRLGSEPQHALDLLHKQVLLALQLVADRPMPFPDAIHEITEVRLQEHTGHREGFDNWLETGRASQRATKPDARLIDNATEPGLLDSRERVADQDTLIPGRKSSNTGCVMQQMHQGMLELLQTHGATPATSCSIRMSC